MKRPKKNPDKTPRSQIVHALRLLWMRSRERGAALKRDEHTCQACHRKASAAKGKEFKVEVHHCRTEGADGIDWNGLADYVYRQLLVEPAKLVTLCHDCHAAEHEEDCL